MLDGGALAALLGAEYVKLRKHPSGGRHGGRPAVYDHSRAGLTALAMQKKEREAAGGRHYLSAKSRTGGREAG